MWGAGCTSHVSMELAALQVLLGDVGEKHLGAYGSFGGSIHSPSHVPESQGRQAGKELRSCFWLSLLTCFSEVGTATTSHVLHCSRTTEPAQAWDVSMSSEPCGCDPFLKREKEQVCELGAIFQLLEWVSVTLVVTRTGLQAGGSMVPSCRRCCHRRW